MNSAASSASAAAAICRRDLLLFASYRTRIVTTFFGAAVSLTLFYYVSRLVSARSVGSPDSYYAFVVVGLTIVGFLTSTLSVPVATLRAELQAGTFERMVVSPFGAVASIASLLIFPVLLSLVTAAFSLAFAGIVFGLDLSWATAPAAVPVALLAAAAFAPFGLLMAAAVLVVKQTNAGAAYIVTAITLLAGLYFPVELLPGWIQWAANVQPFTPAVDLLRHLLVGSGLREPALVELGKLVAFAGLVMPLALLALRWAVRHSRRRGTIIEA